MDGKPSRTNLRDESSDIDDAQGVPQGPLLTLTIQMGSLALKLASDMLRLAYTLLKPLIPQIVPVALLCLVTPILIFFSLSAGFVVWKTSAVSWVEPVYLQYGDGVPPYASLQLGVAASQPYDISLHLVVPSSEPNFALGNFMTTITLTSLSNQTLVTARRPSIITRQHLKSLPFISKKQTLELDVHLLTAYTIGASRVIANIEVGRRDHWRSLGAGEGRELSVLSANLRGTLRHKGVRGISTRFPLFTASIATSSFFAITLGIVVIFLLSSTSIFTTYRSQDDDHDGYDELEDAQPVETGNTKIIRRHPSKRKSLDVKHEPEDASVGFPPADIDMKPIRRRTSRIGVEDDL